MNRLKTLSLALATVLMTAMPLVAQAATKYWVGYTFIHQGTTHYCVIARFKADDKTYTLSKADALYRLIADQVGGLGLSQTVTVKHTYPSQNEFRGVTGEDLTESFQNNGVATCKVNGIPVDALIFLSSFNCEYQNERQLCNRLYVDTGATDLRFLGIPRGPAAIGGIFIKREVWDATSALVLSNPGIIPALPLAFPIGPKMGAILSAVQSQQELQEGEADYNPEVEYTQFDEFIDIE